MDIFIDWIFQGRTFHRINSIDKTTQRQDISQIVQFRNKEDFLKPRWIISNFKNYHFPNSIHISRLVFRWKKDNFFLSLKCLSMNGLVCEMIYLWNDLFMIWIFYEMSGLWNYLSWIYAMTYLWIDLTMKWPIYESMKCPIYKMTYLWNDLSMKWPFWKMTYLLNYLSIEWTIYKMNYL